MDASTQALLTTLITAGAPLIGVALGFVFSTVAESRRAKREDRHRFTERKLEIYASFGQSITSIAVAADRSRAEFLEVANRPGGALDEYQEIYFVCSDKVRDEMDRMARAVLDATEVDEAGFDEANKTQAAAIYRLRQAMRDDVLGR